MPFQVGQQIEYILEPELSWAAKQKAGKSSAQKIRANVTAVNDDGTCDLELIDSNNQIVGSATSVDRSRTVCHEGAS